MGREGRAVEKEFRERGRRVKKSETLMGRKGREVEEKRMRKG